MKIPIFNRLKSGWSIKTANLNQWKQPDTLSEAEHQAWIILNNDYFCKYLILSHGFLNFVKATMQKILDVISQAEQLEKAEQERVG